MSYGGEGGIRTPDTLSGAPVFKTGAINHSATSPATTVLLQYMQSRTLQRRRDLCFHSITCRRSQRRGVFKTACFNRSHIPPHEPTCLILLWTRLMPSIWAVLLRTFPKPPSPATFWGKGIGQRRARRRPKLFFHASFVFNGLGGN